MLPLASFQAEIPGRRKRSGTGLCVACVLSQSRLLVDQYPAFGSTLLVSSMRNCRLPDVCWTRLNCDWHKQQRPHLQRPAAFITALFLTSISSVRICQPVHAEMVQISPDGLRARGRCPSVRRCTLHPAFAYICECRTTTHLHTVASDLPQQSVCGDKHMHASRVHHRSGPNGVALAHVAVVTLPRRAVQLHSRFNTNHF